MDPFGAIWSDLEPSGAIKSHLEPHGVIWSHLEPFGAIWSPLDFFLPLLLFLLYIIYILYEMDQPVSPREFSLVVRTSHRYKKIMTPPKLGPKKTVSIIAFRIALKLDVKIVWFGRQLAVCVQKRHKNAIFGCSCFQKFNFDCLLLKLLIYSQTTENIFKFVCPLLTQSSIITSGT